MKLSWADDMKVEEDDDIYMPNALPGQHYHMDFGFVPEILNSLGKTLGNLTIGIVGNKDLSEFSVNSQIKENGLEKYKLHSDEFFVKF